MKATAVVFDNPKQLSLQALDLPALQDGQVEVAVQYSGISTGTERMLKRGFAPWVQPKAKRHQRARPSEFFGATA